jgi:hypothetical protein
VELISRLQRGASVDTYKPTIDAVSQMQETGWFMGQSFMGNGSKLVQAGFYINKGGAPIGTLRAYLFAHSGVYGVSSVGTGSALATSTTVKTAADIGTSGAYHYFDFDGAYVLAEETPYVIGLIVDDFLDFSNSFRMGADMTTLTHAGNRCTRFGSGSWTPWVDQETPFEVLGLPAGSTPVVPQNTNLPTVPILNELGGVAPTEVASLMAPAGQMSSQAINFPMPPVGQAVEFFKFRSEFELPLGSLIVASDYDVQEHRFHGKTDTGSTAWRELNLPIAYDRTQTKTLRLFRIDARLDGTTNGYYLLRLVNLRAPAGILVQAGMKYGHDRSTSLGGLAVGPVDPAPVTPTAILGASARNTDAAYVGLTFVNGWVTYDTGNWFAGFRRDSEGIMQGVGLVRSGTVNAQIGTLPQEFRPSYQLIFTCLTQGGYARIDIGTNGSITMVGYNGNPQGWLALFGINFII